MIPYFVAHGEAVLHCPAAPEGDQWGRYSTWTGLLPSLALPTNTVPLRENMLMRKLSLKADSFFLARIITYWTRHISFSSLKAYKDPLICDCTWSCLSFLARAGRFLAIPITTAAAWGCGRKGRSLEMRRFPLRTDMIIKHCSSLTLQKGVK